MWRLVEVGGGCWKVDGGDWRCLELAGRRMEMDLGGFKVGGGW